MLLRTARGPRSRALPRTDDRPLTRNIVGGSELAGQALAAGLVDELCPLINPVIGGGKPALPDHVWTELELIDERRFQGGVVHVSYRVPAAAAPTRVRSAPARAVVCCVVRALVRRLAHQRQAKGPVPL